MLLKVLMDFRSLKIRDKHMHQHTYINKKKSNNNYNNNKNKIIKIQQQDRTFGQVHLLRIKRQLQNYFSKITSDSKPVCFNGSIMKLM